MKQYKVTLQINGNTQKAFTVEAEDAQKAYLKADVQFRTELNVLDRHFWIAKISVVEVVA
jgi:Tfp pilus assembly protein PilN